MGRLPLGKKAMTSAERQAKYRKKAKDYDKLVIALETIRRLSANLGEINDDFATLRQKHRELRSIINYSVNLALKDREIGEEPSSEAWKAFGTKLLNIVSNDK